MSISKSRWNKLQSQGQIKHGGILHPILIREEWIKSLLIMFTAATVYLCLSFNYLVYHIYCYCYTYMYIPLLLLLLISTMDLTYLDNGDDGGAGRVMILRWQGPEGEQRGTDGRCIGKLVGHRYILIS
jgi:hypothetical protein